MRKSDLAFATLALSGLVLFLVRYEPPTFASAPETGRIEVAPLQLPRSGSHAVLGSGETLAAVLARLGLSPSEGQEWARAAGGLMDLRSLPVGLAVETELDYHGELAAVRLTPDWSQTFVLERDGGEIVGRREARPVEKELFTVRGEVASSLFEAVTSAGEGDLLALSLAEIFQWDIDFHREVRKGDSFGLLVERIWADGERVAYGPVLAAFYVNRGKRFEAVRYRTADGHWGYYDQDGHPLRKQFLRAPLKFGRLTSRFSSSRMHPVLHRRLPHYGVDYAAPTGTPIHATGNGTVVFVGWKKGGGKTVEIRHPNGYTTAYLHMSRFARGMSRGTRVEQGQVIGYVGSTGLATGPHVDYRITANGRYVNPLTIGNDPAPPLSAAEMPDFRTWASKALPLLEFQGSLHDEVAAVLLDEAPASS